MFAENQQDITEINKTLKKFWEIETFTQNNDLMSINDKIVNEYVLSSLKRSEDNLRYQVSIPWNQHKAELHNNYGQAWQRLKNTESQLKRKSDIEEVYKKA